MYLNLSSTTMNPRAIPFSKSTQDSVFISMLCSFSEFILSRVASKATLIGLGGLVATSYSTIESNGGS